MDLINWKSRISGIVRQYKYVWVVLLAGVVLMMIPGKNSIKEEGNLQQAESSPTTQDLQAELTAILSEIQGAGKVKVLLSIGQGERTLYQTDSTYNESENYTDTRTQTILITDSNRNETGLVHQKNPPVYQGAVILAQGAEDPVVKLAIVEAVRDVTGLGADKISVLKMR